MTRNYWFLVGCIFVTQSALSLEHLVQGRRGHSTKTNDETLQVVNYIALFIGIIGKVVTKWSTGNI